MAGAGCTNIFICYVPRSRKYVNERTCDTLILISYGKDESASSYRSSNFTYVQYVKRKSSRERRDRDRAVSVLFRVPCCMYSDVITRIRAGFVCIAYCARSPLPATQILMNVLTVLLYSNLYSLVPPPVHLVPPVYR